MEFMRRLNDSSSAQLLTTGEYPQWLAVAASQVLAITGENEIIYAGHTLEVYDFYRVLNDSDDVAEGTIQVATANLLVLADFSPHRVRTRVVPLREVTGIEVRTIRDVMTTRGEVPWPDHVVFHADIEHHTYSFPALPTTASAAQYSEARNILKVLTGAMAQP
jgi:hypothetical protein